MDAASRMVFLGYGKWVRADRIYALEPVADERRGSGSRTLVHVDGIAEPLVASRAEQTILREMGQGGGTAGVQQARLLGAALALAERVAHDAEKVGPLLARSIKAEAGVDVEELGRRARRILEATVEPAEPESLF
jgi:hypothetical protein